MHARSAKLRAVQVALLGAAAAVVVPVTQPASAAAACTLVPALRDVTITQGVASYPVLVRGKESLARFYLSLPSCAASGASITVTGATVTVAANGATSSPISAFSPASGATPPAISTYAAAPALDSPADPKFVIPGLVSAGTARFPATFSASISYAARASKSAASFPRS
jgi:hypothetical protein